MEGHWDTAGAGTGAAAGELGVLGAVGAAQHAGLGFSRNCGWQSCSPYFREVGQLSDPDSAPL